MKSTRVSRSAWRTFCDQTRALGLAVSLVASFLSASLSASSAESRSDAASGSPSDPILREALLLNSEGGSNREATMRLRARPRAQVIETVREFLKLGQMEQSAGLDVVALLDLRELLPQVETLARTDGSWKAQRVLNHLIPAQEREKYRASYLKRLSGGEPANIKVILIDGLHEMEGKLPPDLYESLVSDPVYFVREAAVGGFLRNRRAYSRGEQIRFLNLAFRSKPYQVRLGAMQEFARFSTAEKESLRVAFSRVDCEQESQPRVRSVCRDIRKTLSRKASSSRGEPDQKRKADGNP